MPLEPDTLTIRLEGRESPQILVQSFLDVLAESAWILRELDVAKEYILRVADASSNGKLTVTYSTPPKRRLLQPKGSIVHRFIDLLQALDGGESLSGVRPKTVQRAAKLVDVLNDGVAQITFAAPGREPFSPTQRVQATVDEITAAYSEWSTIEGTLETVTVHGVIGFHIYDPITSQKTVCIIPSDKLKDATDALNKRVSVSGITNFKRGKPISITVDGFSVMPDQSTLPQFDDIRGMDITNGEDPVDYVRRLRDAW